MRRWPWHRILTCISVLVIVVGITPFIYVLWQGTSNNNEALSMPLPLKIGEYTSPSFTTEYNDDYQIEIYFLPENRSALNVDWKIVGDGGIVFRRGQYRDTQLASNVGSPGSFPADDAILGHYRVKPGSRQRIILSIQRDVQPPYSDARLHIGLPERGLEEAYGSAAATLWAAYVGGGGGVMLSILVMMRLARRNSLAGAS